MALTEKSTSMASEMAQLVKDGISLSDCQGDYFDATREALSQAHRDLLMRGAYDLQLFGVEMEKADVDRNLKAAIQRASGALSESSRVLMSLGELFEAIAALSGHVVKQRSGAIFLDALAEAEEKNVAARAICPAASQAASKFLQDIRTKQGGSGEEESKLYADQVASFRNACAKVLEAAMDINFAEVDNIAKGMEELSHRTRQACNYSDTPVRDRERVDFMMQVALPICREGFPWVLASKTGKSEKPPTTALVALFTEAADLEKSKPAMAWCVGDSKAKTFLKNVQDAVPEVLKRHRDHVAALCKQYAEAQKKLRSLLVDEKQPVVDEKFAKSFSIKSSEAVKKARLHLVELRTQCSSAVAPAELAKGDAEVMKAKHQVLKWGMLRFTMNGKIESANQDGRELRASLKTIWALSADDDAFKEYLGEPFVSKVKALVEMCTADAAGKAAGNAEKVGKRKAGEGGAGATPTKCRRSR